MTTTKQKPSPRSASISPAYGEDVFAWAFAQADALETRRADRLDFDNLADEIRSLGNNEKNEIESRLAVLLQHLLKWAYQPTGRKGGWEATIHEQRRRIAKRILQSPSLKLYPAEILEEEYDTARRFAAADTDMPLSAFPEACPFTAAEVLDPNFWPGDR